MKIPRSEIKSYANAVSKEIFKKNLSDLLFTESVTLRLSLIMRVHSNEIDEDTYRQVDTYVKNIVFPDNRVIKKVI